MPESEAGADQPTDGVQSTLDPTDVIGLVALLLFVVAGTLAGFFMSIGFACLSVACLMVTGFMAWDGRGEDNKQVTATWVPAEQFGDLPIGGRS